MRGRSSFTLVCYSFVRSNSGADRQVYYSSRIFIRELQHQSATYTRLTLVVMLIANTGLPDPSVLAWAQTKAGRPVTSRPVGSTWVKRTNFPPHCIRCNPGSALDQRSSIFFFKKRTLAGFSSKFSSI